MLVLRLLVMVLTIICLMDGHAEVSSSTTGIRDRRESPAVKTNELEVQIHDRKKKKKPKPSKKKKTKPGKKKKPNKAKPTPTIPVTTTPTVSTSILKTTTILTTPTITTTITTVSTTSTASATETLSTTTSATTTVATSSTASTATTTIPTTATTSSLQTTVATTADSGAGEECKATNGKLCIFPFKDGKEEYSECKNEGGKYFWCATSVYDSGKYKHWSYCPKDRSCPLEGDGECRAENNKPCVFPFKDGAKEYNECANHGGQYFWCATGTNSAGKYTAWSKCPKDGSCPLPQKSSTPVTTPTPTAAITTPLTTGTTMAPMGKKVFNSLKDLVKEESKNDTFEMLQKMNEEMQAINEDLEGQRNIGSNHGSEGSAIPLKKYSVGDEQDGDLKELRNYGEESEFVWSTVTYKGTVYHTKGSNCCSACKKKWSDTLFFEYWAYFKKCWCYKKGSYGDPRIMHHNSMSTGKCDSKCSSMRGDPELVCPSGYLREQSPPLYLMKKEWSPPNEDVENKYDSAKLCAKKCEGTEHCHAIQSTTCMQCRLLTNRKDFAEDPAEQVNGYCLRACPINTLIESPGDCICNGDLNNPCPAIHYCRGGKCESVFKEECTPQKLQEGLSPVSKNVNIRLDGDDVPKSTDFPFAAGFMSLFYVNEHYTHIQRCTAVLVSCQHIITAAHCMQYFYKANTQPRYVMPMNTRVFLGNKVFGEGMDFTGERIYYKSKSFMNMGSAEKWRNANDIVVVKLKEKVPLSETIRPIDLPNDDDKVPEIPEYLPHRSTKLWSIGWGHDPEPNGVINLRQTNQLAVRNNEVCKRQLRQPGIYQDVIETCLEFFKNAGLNPGDSGGPLMIQDPNNRRWRLQGINSAIFGQDIISPGFLQSLVGVPPIKVYGFGTMTNVLVYKKEIEEIIAGESVPEGWIVDENPS